MKWESRVQEIGLIVVLIFTVPKLQYCLPIVLWTIMWLKVVAKTVVCGLDAYFKVYGITSRKLATIVELTAVKVKITMCCTVLPCPSAIYYVSLEAKAGKLEGKVKKELVSIKILVFI